VLNSEGYGLPDVDVCTNRFEGRNICLGPRVVEEPLLAYNDVQDGSDGILVKVQEAGEEAGTLPGDDTPSQNPARYRPHRPQSAGFQGFVRAVFSRGIDRQWIALPSAIASTDRVSTVKDLLSLQVFYPLRDPRGRCGRYVNDLYGYIGLVQVYEGCCLLISRR
jgi:hypothetical protein